MDGDNKNYIRLTIRIKTRPPGSGMYCSLSLAFRRPTPRSHTDTMFLMPWSNVSQLKIKLFANGAIWSIWSPDSTASTLCEHLQP